MSAFSDYLEQVILNHFFRGQAYTPPTTIYVSLHSASPGDTGANEISGGGYSRQPVSFAAPSGGSTSNSSQVQWTAGGNWGSITHWALWDAATAGNMLAWGAFSTARTVSANDVLTIPAGALQLSFGTGTNFSTALRNLIINRIFRNQAFTPTSIFASLHTNDPGDTGANELTGGSYARQSVSFGAPAVDGTGYAITNSADITFSNLPAGTVTHAGLFTASTGGTFYAGDTLGDLTTDADSPVSLTAGDSIVIPAGYLKIRVD